jgi:hypothetical protein
MADARLVQRANCHTGMASVSTTMFQNYLLGATRPVHHFFVIRSNVLYAYSRRHVETVNIFCTIT